MSDKHILFLFIDGVGLGEDDASNNPLAAANLPTLTRLTNGKRWVHTTGREGNDMAAFVPTDAQLGVAGRPQSGTSQAAILTGVNVPQAVGQHYGPKPNAETRDILAQDNFFMRVKRAGKRAALLDAYPSQLLASIARGKTLPSSIQQAAMASGQALFDIEALRNRQAITAEWTGQEWHSHLKLTDTPLYTPQEAGQLLVELSRQYDFAMHSHWMTDYIGHRGTLGQGVTFLERLDGVIEGILQAWQPEEGLVILTSDHGNLEAMDDRHHTENKVPTLIIGADAVTFAENVRDLADFVPLMGAYLEV